MRKLIFIGFLMGLCYAQNPRLEIHHLHKGFYVFTTYGEYKDQLFPANGMYVVTDSGVVMIDTPWDLHQTIPLLDTIEKLHQQRVKICISTHYHDDRTAGVDILRERGIKTYCSSLTYKNGKAAGEKLPEFQFTSDTTFAIGKLVLQTYYPGPGHTSDNIVIWFPNERILYGGCFVKSTEAKTLGNLSDANVPEWQNSMEKTIQKFGSAKYVIPGHQNWKNKKSLQHTLQLIKKHQD